MKKEIAMNKEWCRELIKNSTDPIFCLDSEGIYQFANQAFAGIFGKQAEEIIGKSPYDIFSLEEAEKRLANARLVFTTGKTVEFEGVAETVFGKARHYQLIMQPIKDENDKIYLAAGISRDITERKQAEDLLKALYSRNKAILAAVSDIIMEVDKNKRYVWFNQAGLDFFGKDVVGREASDFFVGEQNIYEKVQPLFNGSDDVIYVESWQRRQDGEKRLLAWWCKTLKDEQGNVIGVLSTAHDITNSKLAEEKLLEKEKMYRLIADNTADVITVFDMSLKITYVSPSILRLSGYTIKETLAKTIEQIIVPESMPLILTVFEEELKLEETGTADPKRTRRLEYKQLRKSSSIIWVESSFSFIRGPNGEPIGIISVSRDISVRKQAEEALHESEKKYRWILENIADVITVMDMNLRFTYVSPSIIHMRGYTAEESMAQTLEQVMTPESLQISAEVFEEELKLEASGMADPDRVRIVVVEQYRKDGSIVIMENHLSFMRDEAKKPVGIISVSHDITERKLAEKKLEQIMEKLRKSLAGTIDVLSQIVEIRDGYTSHHQKKVSNLARMIAQKIKIGQNIGLSIEQIEEIRMAGVIHDIGKMGVPAEILSKPGKLSAIEHQLIKAHPKLAYDVLKNSELPISIAGIVLQHHERLDGSGYPEGLKGDDILIGARIIAVADVVEAMSSFRPYRQALGVDTALAEIEKNKGILYDPDAVDACLEIFKQGFKFD